MLHQHLLRRVTFIIASSNFAGKNIPKLMGKLWPIDNSGSVESTRNSARETLRRFKEIELQNIADGKIPVKKKKPLKNGRRT